MSWGSGNLRIDGECNRAMFDCPSAELHCQYTPGMGGAARSEGSFEIMSIDTSRGSAADFSDTANPRIS